MTMRSTWLVLAWVLGVAVAGAGLAVGCGTSSASSQGHTDAGDATSELAQPEEAAVDAGPDINQDPDVYPANHHPIPQLDYHGGEVLQHIRVVTLTFVGDPHRDAFRDFDHFIVSTAWWKQTAEGYCVDGGKYSGQCVGDGTAKAPEGGAWIPDGSTADGGDGYLDVELPYDLATSIMDGDIQTWLQKHVAAGDFPAPDASTIYAIYFPKTTSVSLGPGQGALCAPTAYGVILGYHSQVTLTPPGGTPVNAQYAALPFCDFGGGDNSNYQLTTLTASHEIAETATDPSGTAFFLSTNDAWSGAQSISGGENGDMCENVNDNTYDESGYNVQRIWSNQAAAQSKQPCQPWGSTYYAAALRTTAQPIPQDNHVSDGYVFVKRGQSTDVIADVFAEKALPHDLLLYAGVPRFGATDPSALAPPGNMVTVTFSQQQVNNGDGVIVTFSAASGATAGDQALVIRAVLENNDYNDWPVIVHVH